MFGPMRKVTFRVRDCTDYMNRTLPTRDQIKKIALIIPSEPTRKKLGFSAVGFGSRSKKKMSLQVWNESSPVAIDRGYFGP